MLGGLSSFLMYSLGVATGVGGFVIRPHAPGNTWSESSISGYQTYLMLIQAPLQLATLCAD